MKWTITHFDDGVTNQIRTWPTKLKARYAKMTQLIEKEGAMLGEPHTKKVGKDLFEIRLKSKEGIGRAFFCYAKGNEIIILHAFIKKSQQMPRKELRIARRRLKEVLKND